MRHTDRKKEKDRTAITIMLCLCVIALTSIFTIKASIDKVSKSANELPVTQEISVKTTQEEEEKEAATTEKTEDKTEDKEDNISASSETSVVDSTESTSDSTEYLCPVNMENAVITKEYSMNMVIYNTTLDQYMTHPGIDIEAPKNSGVLAIADGTVTEVYQDDAYGTTIEITHEHGLRSKYANLESAELVEKGDTVTKGQHIGNVGQTALYESLEKCHLHFEIYQDDTRIDPAEIIDFSS